MTWFRRSVVVMLCLTPIGCGSQNEPSPGEQPRIDDSHARLDVRPYTLPDPWPGIAWSKCTDGLSIAVGFTARLGLSPAAMTDATSALERQMTSLLREANPRFAVRINNIGVVADPHSRDPVTLADQLAHPSDGVWDNLVAVRDDLVFVLDNLTWSASSSVGSTPESRFAVVSHELALSHLSFAHEFGHLAGAGHELGGDLPAAKGFSSGYGWFDPNTQLMSIMSTLAGYQRVSHYSSPPERGTDDGNPATSSANVLSVLRVTVPYIETLSCP